MGQWGLGEGSLWAFVSAEVFLSLSLLLWQALLGLSVLGLLCFQAVWPAMLFGRCVTPPGLLVLFALFFLGGVAAGSGGRSLARFVVPGFFRPPKTAALIFLGWVVAEVIFSGRLLSSFCWCFLGWLCLLWLC
jgi:hypothetical protein